MTSQENNICLPLPNTISNRVTTYESREQYLVNYLEKILPTSDSKGVLEELKKTFTLDKHRWNKKKDFRNGKGMICKRKLSGLKRVGKKHGLKYNELLPLYDMWLDYMRHNLGVKEFTSLPGNPTDSRWETVNNRLLKADFHGAIVSVVRSKSNSMVGLDGIILQDTKNCFRIIGRDNVFRNASFEVFGRELCIKPAERSVKKFKSNHKREL